MKLGKTLILFFGALLLIATQAQTSNAQASPFGKTYQQMTQSERSEFVAVQARRIAAEMSGRDYEFTPAFIEDVQQSVNHYTRRIGPRAARKTRHVRVVLERGRAQAPVLTAAFKARNVSPLYRSLHSVDRVRIRKSSVTKLDGRDRHVSISAKDW